MRTAGSNAAPSTRPAKVGTPVAGGGEAVAGGQRLGHAQRRAQGGPRGLARPRGHRRRDDGPGGPAPEVRQVQAEALEEDAPPRAHAVVVGVPLLARSEAAVHEADHAGPPAGRLHEPLVGEAGAPVGVRGAEHDPVRGLPGLDRRRRPAEGGTEVHDDRTARTLVDLVGDEPRRDARAGGDGLPHLLDGAGDLDGQVDHAVGHGDSSGRGRGWESATRRYQRPPGADSSW